MTTPSTEERKSNIVRMAEKIKRGEAPSNDELLAELEATKEHLEYSSEGKEGEQERVFRDARELVESFKELLVDKNKDENFQRLVEDISTLTEKPVPVGESEQMWDHTRKLLISLKDVVVSVLESPEFRKTLVDLLIIMRSIFFWTDQQTRENLEQMEEQRRNIPSERLEAVRIEDLPEEKKQEIRTNLKHLLKQIREQPTAVKAFKEVLNLASALRTEVFTQMERSVDKDVERFTVDVKQAVEKFTGEKTLEDFLRYLRKSISIVNNDEELRHYLEEWKELLSRGIDDPEVLDSEDFNNKVYEFVVKGREFAKKYSQEETFYKTIYEALDLLEALKNDPTLNQIRIRTQKFMEAFIHTDEQGQKHVDLDYVDEMRMTLVPFLIDRTKEIPIPGIEIQNEEFEYLKLDDIFVRLDDVVPDQIRIHAENETKLSIKSQEPTKSESFILLEVKEITPKVKDFHFAFKKRDSILIPPDEGRANLDVKGMAIVIHFYMKTDASNRTVMGDYDIDVKLNSTKLEIIDASHRIWLNILTTLGASKIKSEVEQAIKHNLNDLCKEWVETFNQRVYANMPAPSDILQQVAGALAPTTTTSMPTSV